MQFQLPGDALDISAIPFEINILAGEWLKFFKLRIGVQIVFRPIIDRLAADEDIRLTVRIAYLEDFRELSERKPPRLRPSGNGPRNLIQIGDAPFCTIAHQ